MDWKVFATAPDQLIGESWCGLVRSAGISCELQPGDAIGFLGISTFPVRLIVPSVDVELARSVLDKYIGADEQPPGTGSEPE